jgi:hypothetical protein
MLCTCREGESCNHIAARPLLYFLCDVTVKKKDGLLALT